MHLRVNGFSMETCCCEKTYLKTKIGVLEIICCLQGVHKIWLKLTDTCPSDERMSCHLLDSKNQKVKCTMDIVITWLSSYFNAHRESIAQPPPICSTIFLNKGDFTVKVWKTLMTQVSFGQTVSYGQLAALSGNSGASRAVGSAMKNNCIPIVIPCHRVIKSDGTIGHFSGGQNVKEWLLKHEKASFKI